MFIIQQHLIGKWDDVEIVQGNKETGLQILKTCLGASRPHRLIERNETLIETSENLWKIEKEREDRI